MRDISAVGDRIIRRHSKSFALASRLLPSRVREDAVAVYAWCRRADDAIDLQDRADRPAALDHLRHELDSVYSSARQQDPVLAIFQGAIDRCSIPREYPGDLLDGMQMDVEERRYDTLDDLIEYCYHVAGCVGLMMCHVMGLRDDRALENATHLGIAMQLTNICRDVAEDWENDRLYLPDALLREHGAFGLMERLGEPFPADARAPAARATERLLAEAERYYRSGDQGLLALSWQCAISIRTARSVYSAIGHRVRRQGADPLAGRAYVSRRGKIGLAGLSLAGSLTELPARLSADGRVRPPDRVVRFPIDVGPLPPVRAVNGGRG